MAISKAKKEITRLIKEELIRLVSTFCLQQTSFDNRRKKISSDSILLFREHCSKIHFSFFFCSKIHINQSTRGDTRFYSCRNILADLWFVLNRVNSSSKLSIYRVNKLDANMKCKHCVHVPMLVWIAIKKENLLKLKFILEGSKYIFHTAKISLTIAADKTLWQKQATVPLNLNGSSVTVSRLIQPWNQWKLSSVQYCSWHLQTNDDIKQDEQRLQESSFQTRPLISVKASRSSMLQKVTISGFINFTWGSRINDDD